jgi:ABC-type spermidine/putrescine transport system permease subunit II
VTPDINAITTIIITVVAIAVATAAFVSGRREAASVRPGAPER